MKKVELFEIIRKEYFQNKESIRQIAKTHGVHRRQVRQAIANSIPPARKPYQRNCSVLTESMRQIIIQWINDDVQAPRKQQHTGKRIYDRLAAEHGYLGHESTVRNYAYQQRKAMQGCTQAFVPQMHPPGAEAEVDWYEIMADLPQGREKIYIFQMRACFSGKEFHLAFRHQNQQAFIEGHVAAFEYFGGVFKVIRYDNLTAAVKKVLRGRKRLETERFIALRSHYLFESSFCLPGLQGAHEKGGVEGAVGRFRRAHLVPVPQAASLTALNQAILAYCRQDDARIIIGKAATVAADWQLEVPCLAKLPLERFTAHDVVEARVDHKSLIAIRGNHYSVPAELVGQLVEAQIFAEQIIVMRQGKMVAQLTRCYGSHQIIAELAHYLPILRHKPGALPGSLALHQARQNNQWPQVLEEYWQALILKYQSNEANRQLIEFLWWTKTTMIPDIGSLIKQAMNLGCYNLESIQSLWRQNQAQDTAQPLTKELLGDLKRYDRPKPTITNYNALLTRGVR